MGKCEPSPTSFDLESLYWGIPILEHSGAATVLTAPVIPYGVVPRDAPMFGTYHCYVADGKFTRLCAAPHRILATGCVSVIEPNFSTGPETPRAAALYGIMRKRTAARFWHRCGLTTFADLNVTDEYLDIAMLGLPQGWTAYATRSHRRLSWSDVERRYELAVTRAAPYRPFFVVVGGGKKARAECARRDWPHVPEHASVARGQEEPYSG